MRKWPEKGTTPLGVKGAREFYRLAFVAFLVLSLRNAGARRYFWCPIHPLLRAGREHSTEGRNVFAVSGFNGVLLAEDHRQLTQAAPPALERVREAVGVNRE